jgi:hypothetical protein
MSSGFKEMVWNPSERAVSNDLNRGQTFKGADLAELFRAICDTFQGSDDLQASSLDTQTVAALSPSSGMILSGLRVLPQVGSVNIYVDPGTMFIYDPDATIDPDESQYKYIRDPGIQTNATLVMTPNSSGSIRIDVIECARVAAPGYDVLEVDNRDIYNQTSGLFTPTTVNKVIAGALQYRVRAGSPGSGFPGTATGWMPLAVASVAPGTTVNDTVTFWDVRPLLADRVHGISNVTTALPKTWPNFTGVDTSDGVHAYFNGSCDVTRVGSLYRLGGQMLRGTPGTDAAAGVDLQDSANWADTISGSGLAWVYLLEPFGLPRWARYTDFGSGSRIPRSPRGIAVLSQAIPPFSPIGNPAAPVQLPASTGLGGSTTAAVAVAALTVSGGSVLGGACVSTGKDQWAAWNGATVTGIAASADVATVTMAPNGTSTGSNLGYPRTARALHLSLSLACLVAAGFGNVQAITPVLFVEVGGVVVYEQQLTAQSLLNASGGSVSLYANFQVTVAIPVVAQTSDTGGFTLKVKSFAGTSVTFESLDASLLGWGL